MPAQLSGTQDGTGLRVAIVASRFNDVVVDAMVSAASRTCLEKGVKADDLFVIRCPGAWELPGLVGRVLDQGGIDAVVALGAVVRGGTPHFDYVAGETSRGLMALATGMVPVAFGLLTTDTMEQALQRAGGAHGNKGHDAALAAIEMATLYRALPSAGLGRRR